MNSNSETVILWSGGLDSTFCIWHYLRTNPDDKVYAYYARLSNNLTKSEMEERAIKSMAPVFEALFPGRFKYEGVIVEAEVLMIYGSVLLPQFPIWLLAMTYIRESANRVALGYVMNDDAISYLDEMRELWKALQPFRVKPVAELVFPVTKWKKEEIWSHLPQELKQHVVSCETPKITKDSSWEPCGHCAPCKRDPKYGQLKSKEPDSVVSCIACSSSKAGILGEPGGPMSEWPGVKSEGPVVKLEDPQLERLRLRAASPEP